ncbi:MAG: SDR family NAD(P)-dependent oxidoreductase [Leucobacter sp.]|nr:SDR family NAD(P)-dependent oxidoreductase [Leucobacter sp.]
MNGTLEGQVAIVTGGGRGLGRAFARELARLGAAVVVNNRNRVVDEDGLGPADHVAAEIIAAGGRAVANHDDVLDPEVGKKLVAQALHEFGRLDILVTSAAISAPQMLHKTTLEYFSQVMNINVTGTVLPTAAAMAHMREAGHGRIILIASTAGLHGETTVSAYAASKGAVVAFGRTAAAEGAGKGVYTNMLLPYATTQMTEAGMDERYAEAMRSELVAPIVAALASPDSTLNGEVIVAAGSSLRVADAVEWATTSFDAEAGLSAADLESLVARSRSGSPRSYTHAQEAFQSFASECTAQHTT